MSNTSQAILLAFAATALFAIAAALAKVAVQEFHFLQILFVRQVIVLLSALPTLVRTFPASLKTGHPLTHGLRLLAAFTALSSGIWAVEVLPLTTAITLAFAQIFFTALLASKFLNEPVGPQRLITILVGFIGVVIVMRPTVDGMLNIHAVIPVAGAFGAAIAVVCVRKLSQSESTATLLAYQSVFVGLIAALPLPWVWVTPTALELSLLIAIGVISTAAQWIGVKALRLGEASVIGNVEYMKLIYAALIGYFVFSEIPDRYTIIGAAIIIASSAHIIHRETRQKAQAKHA
ncbi:DMT family transporter [Aestuariispira ectoiniformans]|uniref:DMT family transporter n=1 Tax=Aestuariispira ectoiniformans TaxID=2775080 RepID=UPI00223BE4F3|nr:DMT family transporter [Aestuariispira ectoiniformans]